MNNLLWLLFAQGPTKLCWPLLNFSDCLACLSSEFFLLSLSSSHLVSLSIIISPHLFVCLPICLSDCWLSWSFLYTRNPRESIFHFACALEKGPPLRKQKRAWLMVQKAEGMGLPTDKQTSSTTPHSSSKSDRYGLWKEGSDTKHQFVMPLLHIRSTKKGKTMQWFSYKFH